MKLLTKLILLPALAAALLAAAPQEEGKRVALIIGNNSYSISPLQNAVNDARAIDKALRDAGFKTILKENASKADMEEALADFVAQLGPDDTALFFYAGHGLQIENENFLVPVDFEAADTVIRAKLRCFSMSLLIDMLKNRPKRSIVILDACRSNPVATSNALQGGLAQPQNPGKEMYIAFSTGPGQVAADNPNGRNSWFSEALSETVAQPGLTLEDVLTRVRARVSNETEGRQLPWSLSSLTTKFYFHPPLNGGAETDSTAAERWMEEARRREQREEWPEAIELVNRVIARKPGGTLEATATAKLPYLEARRDAQVKFDASDFAAAAQLYEKAVKLDPFASDAAFQGLNSYLVNDQLPEALRMIHDIRIHGTSASIAKVNAMLDQLAVVLPAAGAELKAGIPQPPPIDEVFGGYHFGTPDYAAAGRLLQTAPVDVAKWVKEVNAANPPPAPPPILTAEQTAAITQVLKDVLHLEVVPSTETRDILIRKLPTQEYGFVQLDGPQGNTPVIFDGKTIAQQMPAKLQLPVGKYSLRSVKDGQVLFELPLEVKPMANQVVTVKQ